MVWKPCCPDEVQARREAHPDDRWFLNNTLQMQVLRSRGRRRVGREFVRRLHEMRRVTYFDLEQMYDEVYGA